MTAEQANEVLSAFRDHHLQPLVYVTLYYGLRRSEVVGLRWQAIDFINNLLCINHTVVKNLTVVAKDKTKTAASKRTYELFPEIKQLQLQLKEAAAKNKILFGKEYHESDYIFVWSNGVRYSPDYVTRGFQRALKAHRLPKMRVSVKRSGKKRHTESIRDGGLKCGGQEVVQKRASIRWRKICKIASLCSVDLHGC